MGTGMATLMPTIPTDTSRRNRRAAWPSRVKMAVPFPNGLALTSAMASSRRVDPQDRQHRTEDLVPVHLHVRGDPVDQGGPEEEAVVARRAP